MSEETKKTRKFCNELKEFNVSIFVVSASTRQTRGISDRLIAHTYWSGALEFKDFDTPIKATQQKFVDGMNKDGILKAVFVRFEKGEINKGKFFTKEFEDDIEFDGPFDLLKKLQNERSRQSI